MKYRHDIDGLRAVAVVQGNKCLSFNSRIAARLVANEQIDTVILHARWSLYIEALEPDDDPHSRGFLLSDGRGDDYIDDLTSESALVAARLAELIRMLVRADKRVILIGPVPEIPWNVADEVKRSVLFGGSSPIAPSSDRVLSRPSETEAVLEEVALATGATYISLSDQLCIDYCPVHDDSGAYYRDSHHLTPHGAVAWVLPVILEAVKP